MKCKEHFWIVLRRGWLGSAGTWSTEYVPTFDEFVTVICPNCEERKELKIES